MNTFELGYVIGGMYKEAARRRDWMQSRIIKSAEGIANWQQSTTPSGGTIWTPPKTEVKPAPVYNQQLLETYGGGTKSPSTTQEVKPAPADWQQSSTPSGGSVWLPPKTESKPAPDNWQQSTTSSGGTVWTPPKEEIKPAPVYNQRILPATAEEFALEQRALNRLATNPPAITTPPAEQVKAPANTGSTDQASVPPAEVTKAPVDKKTLIALIDQAVSSGNAEEAARLSERLSEEAARLSKMLM
jgi:hypothetical protein